MCLGHFENLLTLGTGKIHDLCASERHLATSTLWWSQYCQSPLPVLIGSMMMLSAYIPHDGVRREELHRRAGDKIIIKDGKRIGAKDFFIGGDLNSEFTLEGG